MCVLCSCVGCAAARGKLSSSALDPRTRLASVHGKLCDGLVLTNICKKVSVCFASLCPMSNRQCTGPQFSVHPHELGAEALRPWPPGAPSRRTIMRILITLLLRTAVALEKVAIASPIVEDFAWITRPLNEGRHSAKLATIGRYREYSVTVLGITPNLFSVLDDRFLMVNTDNRSVGLSLSEQAYTEIGSHSLLMGTTYMNAMNLRRCPMHAQIVLGSIVIPLLCSVSFRDAVLENHKQKDRSTEREKESSWEGRGVEGSRRL